MNKRVILFGGGDEMKSCPAKDCAYGILYSNDHMDQIGGEGFTDNKTCDPTISGDVLVSYLKMNHYQDSMMNVATGAKGANELNSYSVLEN